MYQLALLQLRERGLLELLDGEFKSLTSTGWSNSEALMSVSFCIVLRHCNDLIWFQALWKPSLLRPSITKKQTCLRCKSPSMVSGLACYNEGCHHRYQPASTNPQVQYSNWEFSDEIYVLWYKPNCRSSLIDCQPQSYQLAEVLGKAFTEERTVLESFQRAGQEATGSMEMVLALLRPSLGPIAYDWAESNSWDNVNWCWFFSNHRLSCNCRNLQPLIHMAKTSDCPH